MRYAKFANLYCLRYNNAMSLAEYLEENGLSDVVFARRIGAHRTEVWNYRKGRRMPRADKVAAIEKATRGRVRAKDFDKAA